MKTSEYVEMRRMRSGRNPHDELAEIRRGMDRLCAQALDRIKLEMMAAPPAWQARMAAASMQEIPWHKAPDWANFFAADEDRSGWWHENKPEQLADEGWYPPGLGRSLPAPFKLPANCDWRESLLERPSVNAGMFDVPDGVDSVISCKTICGGEFHTLVIDDIEPPNPHASTMAPDDEAILAATLGPARIVTVPPKPDPSTDSYFTDDEQRALEMVWIYRTINGKTERTRIRMARGKAHEHVAAKNREFATAGIRWSVGEPS